MPGVQALLLGGAGVQVHAPAPQPGVHHELGDVLGRALLVDRAVGPRHRHVAAAHHRDPAPARVGLLPGVDHVVQEAGAEVEPAQLLGLAVARDHAEAGLHVGAEHHLVATERHGLGVVHHRQVVQDRVVLGHGHVVRQARARQRDRHVVLQLPVGADDAVVHVGRVVAVVEEQQVLGDLVDLGMGRDLAAGLRDRLAAAERLQRDRVEFPGLAGHVPQRQHLAGVGDEVGVAGVLQRLVLAAEQGLADAPVGGAARGVLALETLGAHPAVAHREAPVLEVRRVHHAVAVEGVVAALGRVAGVRAGAHVDAVQVLRDRALEQRQVGQRGLVGQRREGAGQQRAVVFAEGSEVLGAGRCVHGGLQGARL